MLIRPPTKASRAALTIIPIYLVMNENKLYCNFCWRKTHEPTFIDDLVGSCVITSNAMGNSAMISSEGYRYPTGTIIYYATITKTTRFHREKHIGRSNSETKLPQAVVFGVSLSLTKCSGSKSVTYCYSPPCSKAYL